jgi:hypothetical protein
MDTPLPPQLDCDEPVPASVPAPSSESVSVPSSSVSASSMSAPPKSRKRSNARAGLEDQYRKSLEVVQQLAKARVDKATARPDDEDDLFGRLVACEMRKLQTPRNLQEEDYGPAVRGRRGGGEYGDGGQRSVRAVRGVACSAVAK